MEVRRANVKDIPGIINLLYQVNDVHAKGRPDLFRSNSTKYTASDLEGVLLDTNTVVLVACDGDKVCGHAFCNFDEVEESENRVGYRFIYIDDICVDENCRGQKVGSLLYNKVEELAKEENCSQITLHVWECNESARSFYDAMGMTPRYTCMEKKIL